ncbi:MAG: nicotinate-nucleotide adenylyltransferase [Clostridia bacterium]|jgi:nicotinate-nucleotide adenylyltransferase|nr:nicotinate-nucleotide adenylyltransferase [Clostridia bacterium]MDN5321719.1 nicotinate-nucleotide adenylyltransferase [Clostridia bacterium]
MERKKAIGIMGGTFDPIHYGHLVTAEAVRSEFGLEKVYFVPSGNPPHKDPKEVSDSQHRYLMTFLSITTNFYFETSPIEINRPGKSYAYDTVKAFRDNFPDYDLYFITGADAIKEILTWHRVEEVLDLCYFVAATRPGYNLDDLKKEELKVLPPEYLERILIIEVPAMAISSTDIKKRVRERKPIKYLLPEAVEHYIYKKKLYV